MTSLGMKRGAFIVLEGCDRSGKTVHAKRLAQSLKSEYLCFPDRSSAVTGSAIDSYLRGKVGMKDQVIHLLFSANRWEKSDEILRTLRGGSHIICDRYAYSGIAFSSAKPDIDFAWCAASDSGLPRPDLVIFLDVSPEEARTRGGFGEEVYEKEEFQRKVREVYEESLIGRGCPWKTVSTDGKSLDDVYSELNDLVKVTLEQERNQDLLPLVF